MTTCEEFVKHAFYEKFHSKPTTECRSTDKLYAGWSDAGYIVTYPDKKVVTYVYDVTTSRGRIGDTPTECIVTPNIIYMRCPGTIDANILMPIIRDIVSHASKNGIVDLSTAMRIEIVLENLLEGEIDRSYWSIAIIGGEVTLSPISPK